MFDKKELLATPDEITRLENIFPEIIKKAKDMKPIDSTMKDYSNGFPPYERSSENSTIEEIEGINPKIQFNYCIQRFGSKEKGYKTVYLGLDEGICKPPADGFQGNMYSIFEREILNFRKKN